MQMRQGRAHTIITPIRIGLSELATQCYVPLSQCCEALTSIARSIDVKLDAPPCSHELVSRCVMESAIADEYVMARQLLRYPSVAMAIDGTTTLAGTGRAVMGASVWYETDANTQQMNESCWRMAFLQELNDGHDAQTQTNMICNYFADMQDMQTRYGMHRQHCTWLHHLTEIVCDNENVNTGPLGGIVAKVNAARRNELKRLSAYETAINQCVFTMRVFEEKWLKDGLHGHTIKQFTPETPQPTIEHWNEANEQYSECIMVRCHAHVANLVVTHFITEQRKMENNVLTHDQQPSGIERMRDTDSFAACWVRRFATAVRGMGSVWSCWMRSTHLFDTGLPRVSLTRWFTILQFAKRLLLVWNEMLNYPSVMEVTANQQKLYSVLYSKQSLEYLHYSCIVMTILLDRFVLPFCSSAAHDQTFPIYL
jgi:hypothetical protein